MAGFDVNLKDVASGTSGLVGASRGSSAIAAKETVARTAVDNTAAQAVQGIGSLFNQAVGAVDQTIKRTIDTVSREEVDSIFNEMGVNDVTLIEGTSIDNEPIPSDIGKAERTLQKLTQARNQGGLTDNAYWARVNSVSRQLRSRFPGHIDYIDQRISQVSGGNPQQQIMRNLMEQAQNGNRAALAAEKDYNDLVERATFAGYLPADYSREKYPNRESLLRVVAPFAAAKEAREAERAAYAAAKDRRELAKDEYSVSAKRTAADMSMKLFSDATSAVGQNYLGVVQGINDITSGRTQATPENLTALRNQFNQLRVGFNSELNNRLTVDYPELDAKGREEAMLASKNMLDTLEYAIANKDVGVLNLVNNTNELYKAGDTQKILNMFPEFRFIQTLKETGGPGAVEFFLNSPDSNLRTVQARVSTSNALLEIFGDNKTLSEAVTRQTVLGNTDAAVGFSTMEKTVAALKDPNMNLEMKKRAAYALFDTKNISFVSGLSPTDKSGTRAQHAIALDRMVNAGVHQAMVQLRDQGQTDLWDKYVGWTRNTFTTIAKQNMDILVNAAAQNDENFKVRWIGDKFVAELTEQGRQGVETRIPGRTVRLQLEVPPKVRTAVENLNGALRSISHINKDDGVTPQAFVERMMPQLPKAVFQPLPAKLGMRKDPATGEGVVRFDVGDEGPQGDVQITPMQGDSIELDELSATANRLRQDITLMRNLAAENPDDPAAQDEFDRVLTQYREIMNEINSINQRWIEEFSRKPSS